MRHHFHFGRHRGSHGLGRFGKGFMDGGDMGGRTFGMGRKLASTDLQLIILTLLADKPMHGYEIIKTLDERSKGFYVPSPGMVYPALTYLEEIGHAVIESEGTRKLYHLTQPGRDHLEANRERADSLLSQFDRVGSCMDRVRHAMSAHDRGDSRSGGRDAFGSKELARAWRELESALADNWSGDPDRQKRLLAILTRAAADILGDAPQ